MGVVQLAEWRSPKPVIWVRIPAPMFVVLYIDPPPDTISRGTQGIFPSSAGWAAHPTTL